jgi:hypothetical protein
MIDFHSFRPTIRSIGREDRAMLGSNPSARTDGGTSAGASALNRCSCSQEFQMMFCPKSDKPMPHENYKISKNHNERCAIWQYLQGLMLLGDTFQGLRFAPPPAIIFSPLRGFNRIDLCQRNFCVLLKSVPRAILIGNLLPLKILFNV